MRLNLKKITALCFDGQNLCEERIKNYNKILKHMLDKIDFFDVKFFSTFSLDLAGVKNYKIEQKSHAQYSSFCITELVKHVDSEFCLVFQYDGFVLNPNCWTDDFFNFDYIGAPWPLNQVGDNSLRVGNGGFSLRSKKFLENSSKLPKSQFFEDAYILIKNRSFIMNSGIKLAPLEVARRFSIEHPVDQEHKLDDCFGFHGKGHLKKAMEYIN